MPFLAGEVKQLIELDPVLVMEIYRVAFTHIERSKEITPMGSGQIIPLTSTRQQDYHGALYELAEIFPEFLERAPRIATHTLITVMDAYVSESHPMASGETYEEAFDVHGHEARVRTDYSSIWEEGDTYRHDDPLKMFDAFQKYIEK